MSSSSEVLIVGAGLAGLNAAITLQNAGVDVQIVEASDRAGGRVTSDVIDGFICDRGFQLINSKYPALQELDVIKEIDFVSAPRVIDVAIGDSRHAIGHLCCRPFQFHTGSYELHLAIDLNCPTDNWKNYDNFQQDIPLWRLLLTFHGVSDNTHLDRARHLRPYQLPQK